MSDPQITAVAARSSSRAGGRGATLEAEHRVGHEPLGCAGSTRVARIAARKPCTLRMHRRVALRAERRTRSCGVPELHQVVDRQLHRRDVVVGDERGVDARQPAVDEARPAGRAPRSAW